MHTHDNEERKMRTEGTFLTDKEKRREEKGREEKGREGKSLMLVAFSFSPVVEGETLKGLLGLLEVFLDLLAHVEDGTVTTGAEDGLVERALTVLALCPDTTELLFQHRDLGQLLLVNQVFLGFTALTQRVACWGFCFLSVFVFLSLFCCLIGKKEER